MTPEQPISPDPPRRGRGRPPRDPSTPPRDPGVIGGRAAESFSRAILNSLPALVAVIEMDGRVVAVNKAWERFTQESAGVLKGAPELGGNYLDAMGEGRAFEGAAAATALAGIQEVLDRTRARYELEFPVELPAGRRWFLLSVTPLLGAEGGAVLTHAETTDRRRALEATAEQHRMLEAVLDSTADGVVVSTLTGDFEVFNQAAREIAGVGIVQGSPEDWSQDYGIFHMDRTTLFKLEEVPLYRAIMGESTDDVRMFIKNPAIGGGRFISVSGRPWTTPDGERVGGVVVFRDITAHVLAEEQSRLQVEVLDAVPVAVLAMDAEGGIVYWNPAAERLMGWSAADLVGRRGRDVLLDEAQRAQVDAIRTYVLSGRPFRGEFKVTKPDGSQAAVLATASARHRADGSLDGFVMVGVDVTDSTMTQEALRAREYELRQFQKMEAIGRLAGGVAHDFNNLLTVIRGYTDILLRRVEEGAPLRAEVEQVSRAVDRASELTGQLLAFGRRQPMQPTLLNLNSVVSDYMPMLRRTLGEDIRVRVELDPGLGLVRADAAQIGQVLLNVVLNARDAMEQGGDLVVSTRLVELDDSFPGDALPGPYAELAVGDTGVGMSEEVQARVLEPFFTTKDPDRGTGLGLSTAHGIVRQLGGHVRLYSEEGRGTTIKFYLPREFETTAPPVTPAPPTAVIAAAPAPPATLLLVEDDAAVRSIERRLLEMAGHVVLEAKDGETAIELARAHAGVIDLVVCDVMLPDRNGREVVDALKRLRADLRVLFVSGHTREIVQKLGAATEHPFLQKPFSAADLHEAVRTALNDSPTSPSR